MDKPTNKGKPQGKDEETLKSITISGQTFLTAIGLGEVLQMSYYSVMELARKGAIPYYRFRGRRLTLFIEEEVLQALMDSRQETKAEIEARVEETGYARVIPRKRKFAPRESREPRQLNWTRRDAETHEPLR